MWIDVHTHLEMLELDTDTILAHARTLGVGNMITIGCHPGDFAKVCAIAESRYPTVAATLGVHPHEAKLYSDEIENQIREGAAKNYVIGIGEIGLDYYYNHSEKSVQQDAFSKQMKLAHELGLPVEIHCRDAEDDVIAELKKWHGKVSGVMHCFTGTAKLAQAALDVGFYISISGVVTFKNAEPLREIVKTIPMDRLLVETDAPFLAPVPMRGNKNQPAFVVHTAEKVAEVKGVTPEILKAQLQKNVRVLFPKWNF